MSQNDTLNKVLDENARLRALLKSTKNQLSNALNHNVRLYEESKQLKAQLNKQAA